MATISRAKSDLGSNRLSAGAIAGIAAGVIFAMFEMVMAAIMGDGFFMPLRMIAAIVLGREALEASYSLAGVIPAGLMVHMVLSAIYGAIFVAVAHAAGLFRSRVALILAASAYGFALWIINFFGVTLVAFDWFTMANDIVQFVAHTFFFGTVLGLILALRPPADRSS